MALWAKGQSGNPKGRPRNEKSIAGELRKELKKRRLIWDEDRGKYRTISKKEALAKVLMRLALEGDLRAARLVLEHVDGLPPARHEISGPNREPIPIVFPEKYDGI